MAPASTASASIAVPQRAHLDPAEIAREYHEQGFAVARGALDPADLEPLRGVLARAVDTLARREFDGAYPEASLERRLALLVGERDPGWRGWDEAFSPELHALIAHPAIARLVAPLVGEHIHFDGDCHLRPKLPGSEFTAFPWHQDSQYYNTSERGTEAMTIVTVWVPLIDVDEVNGCLWLFPGSHRWGLLAGARGADQNMRTFDDVEARAKPVPVPMRRGDVILFSNLTVHGSRVNRSQDVRWSVDIRYSPLAGPRRTLPHHAGFTVRGPAGTEPYDVWAARRAAIRR